MQILPPGLIFTLNIYYLKIFLFAAALLLASVCTAQEYPGNNSLNGMFSLGTRNTLSFFNEDGNAGKGIGGQFRVRLGKKLNSEWYLDYITSRNGSLTYRNDYHIGWSLMFYPGDNYNSSRFFQPYFIAGHCFDKSVVTERNSKTNSASRLSMATQAGAGAHLNITPRFDCSLSAQYMLHFGKELEVGENDGAVIISKADHSHADGHLLFTISFNYKLFRLWR